MYYWKKINIIIFVLLIVLTIPSMYNLLGQGLIKTDDLTWMVIRFGAFFNTLRDGQIPVRVLEGLNNGYSYPVANFLYPGFMYFGSLIHILGFGFIETVKIILIISFLGSGMFTYLWLRNFFDPYASLLGSLFYIYTPYHLYDIYTRGSIGEALAIMLIPLIFNFLEKKNLSLTAFTFFFIILSHNSIALLLLPVLIIYSLLINKFKAFLFSGTLGVFMSAFFIIPAIYELRYTKFSNTNISDPLSYFADLKLIGYSSVVVIVLFLVTFLIYIKTTRITPQFKTAVFFLLVTMLTLILSSSISLNIWKIIPAQYIQFPFRFLGIFLIGISFLAGFVVNKYSGIMRVILILVLLLVLGFSSKDFLGISNRDNYPDDYYLTNMDTTTVRDEYMPKWVKEKPLSKAINDIETIDGSATFKTKSLNSKNIIIDFDNANGSTIRINRIYYPGWIAYINHEKIPINYDNKFGVMDIKIARNSGQIYMIFQETPLRFFSNFLTVISIIIGIFIFIRPMLKFK